MTTSKRFRMGGDSAFETPSTFMPSDGAPNPFYNKVNALWDEVSTPGVVEDIAECVELFVKDGVFDECGFLEYVRLNFDDQLDDLIDTYENAEPVDPVMPPAPSPKTLYNRVADCAVVDIGSGDCEKLKLCQGVVTAVDKVPQKNSHYDVQELDCSFELRDFMEQKKDAVVTSFNSLTQLQSLEQVDEFDGVHILPDMAYVKDHFSVVENDGVLVWGGFKDKDHGVRGDSVGEGYVAYNTYARKNVSLSVCYPVETGLDFHVQIEDIYYRPPHVESTPKYDGEAMLVVAQPSNKVLVRRNGTGFLLEGGEGFNAVLAVEKLPLDGPPKCFVLLRVMKYRNYYPFHGINNLRTFCAKIHLRLGGVPVYAPGDSRLQEFASDGQIFRFGQMDYRYKTKYTVDLDDVGAAIRELNNEFGYRVTVDQDVGELAEYTVDNINGSYRLTFHRLRPDKTTKTSVQKIARMMQWI